jgi:hypothetical protein
VNILGVKNPRETAKYDQLHELHCYVGHLDQVQNAIKGIDSNHYYHGFILNPMFHKHTLIVSPQTLGLWYLGSALPTMIN